MTTSDETLSLTDSEQDLYNALTETQKSIFKALHLRDKIKDREILSRLQDVTSAVKEIRETQRVQVGWSITLSRLWKKVIAFLNSEIHKANLDDRDL